MEEDNLNKIRESFVKDLIEKTSLEETKLILTADLREAKKTLFLATVCQSTISFE